MLHEIKLTTLWILSIRANVMLDNLFLIGFYTLLLYPVLWATLNNASLKCIHVKYCHKKLIDKFTTVMVYLRQHVG